jgi:hypothetical protein
MNKRYKMPVPAVSAIKCEENFEILCEAFCIEYISSSVALNKFYLTFILFKQKQKHF